MDEPLYEQLQRIEERQWWFRGRRAVMRGLLRHADLDESPRILDAGCGTGRNLQDYSAIGPAQGVEHSATALAFSRERGYVVHLAPLEDLPFAPGTFDLVCATDVLEHIEDDAAALRELHRVARPGGSLLVTVPAYGWM